MCNPYIPGWINYDGNFSGTQRRPTLKRSMSSAGRAVSSSGCVTKPKEREIGLTGFAGPMQPNPLRSLAAKVMAMAEHREPYEARGSRTVLGALGVKVLRATGQSRLFRGVRVSAASLP